MNVSAADEHSTSSAGRRKDNERGGPVRVKSGSARSPQPEAMP
jgi:hypothetical protein